MGYWKSHIFIILPQALKLVIPGIANTFIALFKDTPLVFVVGLLEILGMVNLAKQILRGLEWQQKVMYL